MPKSVQPKAKADIHEIWMAATRADADKSFDTFLEKYSPKYPEACKCLSERSVKAFNYPQFFDSFQIQGECQ